MSPLIVPYTVSVRKETSYPNELFAENEWTYKTCDIFILSEADLFGTFRGESAKRSDYTYGDKKLVTHEEMLKDAVNPMEKGEAYTLRSPANRYVLFNGQYSEEGLEYLENEFYYRPAMWIKLPSE